MTTLVSGVRCVSRFHRPGCESGDQSDRAMVFPMARFTMAPVFVPGVGGIGCAVAVSGDKGRAVCAGIGRVAFSVYRVTWRYRHGFFGIWQSAGSMDLDRGGAGGAGRFIHCLARASAAKIQMITRPVSHGPLHVVKPKLVLMRCATGLPKSPATR